jgi:hypothetical protein
MNADDIGFLEWAFKGLVGAALTIGGWLWIRLVNAVAKTREDLSKHEIYSERNYATKTDVTATMVDIKDTIKRTHERIDGIYEMLRERN